MLRRDRKLLDIRVLSYSFEFWQKRCRIPKTPPSSDIEKASLVFSHPLLRATFNIDQETLPVLLAVPVLPADIMEMLTQPLGDIRFSGQLENKTTD